VALPSPHDHIFTLQQYRVNTKILIDCSKLVVLFKQILISDGEKLATGLIRDYGNLLEPSHDPRSSWSCAAI